MRLVCVAMACLLVLYLGVADAQAGQVTEADVILKSEVENLPVTERLSPAIYDGVTGMAFPATGLAMAGLELETGDYTLLVHCYAPAGDQDGFFVEIEGRQTRRTAPIGRWGTLAYPFTTEKAGKVGISIIGQEPGMTVDAVAVVKGTHQDNDPRFDQVPGEMKRGVEIKIEDLPRLALTVTLAEKAEGPLTADEHTVYIEHFDAECNGVTGDYHWGEGQFGQALYLDVPDGRFAVDASGFDLAGEGTVEWWVKPRPAQQLWSDQGWHYFLHCRAKDDKGLQLDLSRHPKSQLRLIASSSEGPYFPPDKPGTREWAEMSTSSLAFDIWHHVLVSWKIGEERTHLWVMVDGVGRQSFFPTQHSPAGFSAIEFGNTPSHWDVPYLFIDGGIDEIRIQNISVADRLAK